MNKLNYLIPLLALGIVSCGGSSKKETEANASKDSTLQAVKQDTMTIPLKSDVAYYARANAKNDLGDYKGALEDLTKAIELNPKNDSAYNKKGNIKYYKLGDFSGAVEDLTKAIELNQKFDWAYFVRGEAKMFLKDQKGACADYKKAAELGNARAKEEVSTFCN